MIGNKSAQTTMIENKVKRKSQQNLNESQIDNINP